MPRKTSPRVRNGKVQKTNCWRLSPHYSINTGAPEIVREKPGEFGKHFLRIEDIKNFISILPDWEELSVGLKAVVLAEAEDDCYGWHTPGIVAVCAWTEGLVAEWSERFIKNSESVLSHIDVNISDVRKDGSGWRYREVRLTPNAIKAFLLMDVLLHELGHHHDRMTTRSKSIPARGESYAEQYAVAHSEQLWDAYWNLFDY